MIWSKEETLSRKEIEEIFEREPVPEHILAKMTNNLLMIQQLVYMMLQIKSTRVPSKQKKLLNLSKICSFDNGLNLYCNNPFNKFCPLNSFS